MYIEFEKVIFRNFLRFNRYLRESRYADIAIVMYLAKKFITKFSRWKAAELGIIDAKGNIIKKKLETREEKAAFTILDRFVLKVRKLVGDHLFLKLGITALILSDHKLDGKIIEETGGTDETFLKMLKEDILEDVVNVSIPLEGRAESIKMEFEKNNGFFSFNISMFLGQDMVSTIGGNFLPVNETNKRLFEKLNDIFSNLRYGDNENIFLNLGDLDVTVNVNYGENEIKMVQQTESDDVHSDLYILFGTESERTEFLRGWGKYYNQVMTSLKN
ncbi:MAG: hypothetical protein KAS04_07305 [Candidatus Aenigmarchaeota archaeon]|nr:hypothetical protein [Candidatus Aenigmarchaeota archaeon]